MNYRITADERVRFKRCRRQWDFASPHRRNLQPSSTVAPALSAALTDALAVYYYPGTWDWQHEVTQPLVHKALKRSLENADVTNMLSSGTALLDCYDAWASTVDDFAPIKVSCDVNAIVPDPDDPERGLLIHDGSPVMYPCRIDLLAMNAADELWVVRHQIVDEWQDPELLFRDEDIVAACWAFEQDYLGVEITGTIHNELRIAGPLDYPPAAATTTGMKKTVGQSEPSGGGRLIPQHRRISAHTAHAESSRKTEQRTVGVLRRTCIRRTRSEITAVGMLIAAEARDMTSWPVIYPTPAAHCRMCEFRAPCTALTEGTDAEPLLAANFRQPPAEAPKPRLGQSTWGFGRGAAPQW